MISIKERLQQDVKQAMRDKDAQRLSVLRFILAAIKQIEVDKRIEIDDVQTLAILDKQLKQRQETMVQFEAAGRADLVDKEKFEIGIIQHYRPTPLNENEIVILLDQAIATSQATSIRDMGKVMAILKPQIQGRADLAVVSEKIKDRLS